MLGPPSTVFKTLLSSLPVDCCLSQCCLLQITVTKLYPPGVEPPPKRRHVEQRRPSQLPAKEARHDINNVTVGAAQPVDDVVPEQDQSKYAGLGLESSDED